MLITLNQGAMPGQASRLQEMADATGTEQGTMQQVVDACLRVQCGWLNVYATDVLKATPGVSGHNADWQAALAQGAAEVGP